eukprot:1724094-Rhodomonas_salina.2
MQIIWCFRPRPDSGCQGGPARCAAVGSALSDQGCATGSLAHACSVTVDASQSKSEDEYGS